MASLSSTVDTIIMKPKILCLNCFSRWPCSLNLTWKIFHNNRDATIEDTSLTEESYNTSKVEDVVLVSVGHE